MKEHEKFAEELIARGLERAGEVEPLAGLEERLLGKLEAESERRMRWWWMAAPVAAAMLFAALIYFRPVPPNEPAVRVENAPQEPQRALPSSEAAANAKPPATASPGRQLRKSVTMAAQAAPKQEVFPAPAPLSDEERILVALAHRRPRVAEQVAEQQKRPVEKLSIAAIRIEPLVPEETNGIE